MTKTEYEALQHRVVSIAKMAYETDVDPMLEAIAKADSIGPFVDPTLWIRGHEKMAFIKQLAEGVKRLKDTVAANLEKILAVEVREARRRLGEEEDPWADGV